MYTWDDINLKTEFNVDVLEGSGFFDIIPRKGPTEVDFGVNSEGVTAFTDATDIWVEPKDILLKCAIRETTQERLHLNFAGLVSKITEPGLHELVIPDIANLLMVYHRDAINAKIETPWRSNVLVLKFDIKLRWPVPLHGLPENGNYYPEDIYVAPEVFYGIKLS